MKNTTVFSINITRNITTLLQYKQSKNNSTILQCAH